MKWKEEEEETVITYNEIGGVEICVGYEKEIG